MSIPSVIRLLPAGTPVGTPAEGPTGGRSLVEIYGDGFRLTPDVAPDGPLGPISSGIVIAEVPKTVSVTFGGVEALEVLVIKSNLLRVWAPISPLAITAPDFGVGAVDVVITNLDDSGVAIPGETVTETDGWTYRRTKLDGSNDSDLVRLIRTFIRSWMLQVIPEVVFTTHTDYDTDTTTAEVEIAQMPAIVLTLNNLPENRFYSCNEGPEVKISDERVEQHRRTRTIDLIFEVIGISDNPMEILNLLAVATDFIERNPYVSLIRDPSDLGLGSVEYELDYQPGGGFNMGLRPNGSNIHSFSGTLVIRGFTWSGLAGLPGDSLTGLFRTLTGLPSLDVESSGG